FPSLADMHRLGLELSRLPREMGEPKAAGTEQTIEKLRARTLKLQRTCAKRVFACVVTTIANHIPIAASVVTASMLLLTLLYVNVFYLFFGIDFLSHVSTIADLVQAGATNGSLPFFALLAAIGVWLMRLAKLAEFAEPRPGQSSPDEVDRKALRRETNRLGRARVVPTGFGLLVSALVLLSILAIDVLISSRQNVKDMHFNDGSKKSNVTLLGGTSQFLFYLPADQHAQPGAGGETVARSRIACLTSPGQVCPRHMGTPTPTEQTGPAVFVLAGMNTSRQTARPLNASASGWVTWVRSKLDCEPITERAAGVLTSPVFALGRPHSLADHPAVALQTRGPGLEKFLRELDLGLADLPAATALHLVGFADGVGPSDYNLRLSERRSEWLKRWIAPRLSSQGSESTRMVYTHAFGETIRQFSEPPLADVDSNRRVVLAIWCNGWTNPTSGTDDTTLVSKEDDIGRLPIGSSLEHGKE
ncbi:MAG: hypothetical protein KDK91_29850, partial [Gammaproteobacteria bacterium]|nr:hypothetical protein [Gammaproteobacteria bacterium]